jgi:hypothetical protein
VSLDNVIAVLKLVQSDKGGVVSAVVKEFSIMFVLRHYQDVIVQQAFETVGPALLVEIMRLYQQFTATKSSKYQAAAAARPVEIPPSKLADDLARLRRDETTWDFTFYVRGTHARTTARTTSNAHDGLIVVCLQANRWARIW